MKAEIPEIYFYPVEQDPEDSRFCYGEDVRVSFEGRKGRKKSTQRNPNSEVYPFSAVSVGRDGIAVAVTTNTVEIVGEIWQPHESESQGYQEYQGRKIDVAVI